MKLQKLAMKKAMSDEWDLLDSMYIRSFFEAEWAVASGGPASTGGALGGKLTPAPALLVLYGAFMCAQLVALLLV